MGLFNQQSKVKAGKSVSADASKKGKSLFASLAQSWKKLDSMDQKKAYTWGAVSVAVIVLLLMLASFASSAREQEDFSDFETRGYDLARMPFSSDEAEAYLLASKYPDMKEPVGEGLYSAEEKAERQAEDEQALLEKLEQAKEEQEEERSARTSRQNRDRYVGAGVGRTGAAGKGSNTKVGKLSGANLKSASGSGVKSTFGATGDFSNFKNQNKGKEINHNAPMTAGSGNARTALQQMAQASRAAAGLKDDKMLNAKKALMGGKVEGSDAFMDNGAIDLTGAKGLELDPNAPLEAGNLAGLDDKLKDAKDQADKDDKDGKKYEWWQEMVIGIMKDVSRELVKGAIDIMLAKIKAGTAAGGGDAGGGGGGDAGGGGGGDAGGGGGGGDAGGGSSGGDAGSGSSGGGSSGSSGGGSSGSSGGGSSSGGNDGGAGGVSGSTNSSTPSGGDK